MSVDPLLIAQLREQLIAELEDDYVTVLVMMNDAGRLVPGGTEAEERDLVVETLATLIDHPDVKVVDGPMARTFTTGDELRAHVALVWPASGQLPPDDLVVWLLDRDDPDGNAAS